MAPTSERPSRRSLAASLLLHLVALAGILPLPAIRPAEVPLPLVKLILQEPGSAGAAGGSGAGAGGGSPDAIAADTPAETAAEPPAPEPQTRSKSQSAEAAAAASPAPSTAREPGILPPLPLVPRPHRKPLPPSPSREVAQSPPPPEPAPPPAPLPRAAAPPATIAGTPGGTAGSGPRGDAGAGQAAAGAGSGVHGVGMQGPGDDYLEAVRRWLARFKHYPAEADRRKQEGRVLVRFTIMRDGAIRDPAVVRSSGFPLLDAAALRMLHEGSPVPPLPRWYAGGHATLTMPVDFSIGFFEKLFR